MDITREAERYLLSRRLKGEELYKAAASLAYICRSERRGQQEECRAENGDFYLFYAPYEVRTARLIIAEALVLEDLEKKGVFGWRYKMCTGDGYLALTLRDSCPELGPPPPGLSAP